jgi:ATPases with chaperone activity, ATP-binding subunit
VIMTSNLGTNRLLAAAAAGRPVDEVRDPLLAARTHFRPEFLNRIVDVVLFHTLGRAELHRITEMLLVQTAERLGAQGIALNVTDAAVDWLAAAAHHQGVSWNAGCLA